MSADTHRIPPALDALRNAARRRAVFLALIQIVPPLAALGAVLGRGVGSAWGIAASLVLASATIAMIARILRAYDARWLGRRLAAVMPAGEDSFDLLLRADEIPINPLQSIQRERLLRRLAALEWPDLRAPWPRLAFTAPVWLGALVLIVASVLAPPRWMKGLAASPAGIVGTAPPAVPAATDLVLRILPPAYTGLPQNDQGGGDARVPEGSLVQWRLRAEAARDARVTFADARTLELRTSEGLWQAEQIIGASTLYRIVGQGLAESALHRLEVVPDLAPEITVRAPEKTLTELEPGQKRWNLAFEARDDYGLGAATLSIALAQGSGEQITVTKKTLALEGHGDARSRRYEQTLDLEALGFAKGDDLIVRLSVADNRPQQANVAQSPSLILRWPPEVPTMSAGMEGLVQKAMPAYFRSERQIILDTEALIAAQPGLATAEFAKRADELGVDQKVLRLRYGQFLGEQFESAAEDAPPGSRDPQAANAALANRPPEAGAPEREAKTEVGREGDVTREYGHVHDIAEAATLIDPETRRTLKAVLDEMWQAELQLRQAAPETARPYEYKALDLIKQVQQAERIYLARAGVALPEVDATRRLSGERKGLMDRAAQTAAAQDDDAVVVAAHQQLRAGATPDWGALHDWLVAHRETLPDALGALAALDRAQRAPDCAECRDALVAALWAALPAPAAAVQPRRAPDAAAAAYLRALPSPPAP